ncbi:phosphosulfolactate synthase [Planctomonas sp. JC2975]|uniref:phosphosulfolactate synthase n=1 Tax=Planctomonas sp. JC2975 TaxID=2729626 RepID=UPI00147282C0|nr:phosphosulfolactate synthase [Planctomonas sp. JC2975]NNC12303.1 phosphosulfolactate synthase [Planctomonas sp. JC2975]
MLETSLRLPLREAKPRTRGRTMMIDGGLPTAQFVDTVDSHSDLVDVVKFGWGTALVTAQLTYKIDALLANGVDFYFGGTLFEKYVSQGMFDEWRRFVDEYEVRTVEISNGTIALSNERKADYIARVASDYRVYSEVGYKESERSETMRPELWVRYINEDLAAGAHTVITEARESGKSGIARSNGELRYGLIEEILESGVDVDRLMFETPTKDLQNYFIRRVGPNVNVGNIAHSDLVPLETLRLGLRSDTLLALDAAIDPSFDPATATESALRGDIHA